VAVRDIISSLKKISPENDESIHPTCVRFSPLQGQKIVSIMLKPIQVHVESLAWLVEEQNNK
jgi:hypothetical protein